MTNHPRRLGRRKLQRQGEARLTRAAAVMAPHSLHLGGGVDLTRYIQSVRLGYVDVDLGLASRRVMFYPAT